jgi:D-3-phosphoglycerate dehydrogenase
MNSKILVKRIGLSPYQTESSILFEKELFDRIGCSYEAIAIQEELKKKPKDNSYSQELGRLGQGAEVILINTAVRVCENVLKHWEDLKLLLISSSGYDHVDLESLWSREIRVVRLAEARKNAVAEHTLSFLLSMLRKISTYEKTLREDKVWNREVLPGLSLIKNRTLGVIGYGAIGEEVSQTWRSLGGKVRVYDPKFNKGSINKGSANKGSIPSLRNLHNDQDLSSLLRNCEILTLHCNLTEKTREMVNDEFLGQLRTGSVLVNTARGELIEAKAFRKALESNQISGAALDVFGKEPPFEDKNWLRIINHPNVISTPHVAGLHETLVKDISELAAQKVKAWIEDKPIPFELKENKL